MLQNRLLSASKDSAKKEVVRPPFKFQRALSSDTVPLRRPKDLLEKPLISKRRCQSLSPCQTEKKYAIEYKRRVPGSESKYLNQDPELADVVTSQRVQTKTLRLFATKKREFIKSKRTLMSYQDTFLEQYAALRELEKRAGLVDKSLEEIRLVTLKGWPAHDLLLLIRDDLEVPTNCEIGGVFGPHVVDQMEAHLNSIPVEVTAMGLELMKHRLDILNLMRNKHRSDRATYQSNLEWKAKNQEFDEESDRLNKMVADMAESLKSKIIASFDLVKLAWKDRESITKNIDRLQKENLKLQYKVDEFLKKEAEYIENGRDGIENSKKFQNLIEELKKERGAKEHLKELVASAESMLRGARSKITTLEKQLKETKCELETVRHKHKDLEHLYRHRENNYDAHAKKLIEVSKTGEITIDTLSRQRDALELRVKELHEQAEELERAAAAREASLKARSDTLMAKVAQQEKNQKLSEERIAKYEDHIKDLEAQMAILRERSYQLAELERQHCLDFIPSKESEPSNRETELWKELQTTRHALANAEEELRQSRADKDNFLNSLARIAQEEGGDKEAHLGAELLSREKKINELQQTIEEHRQNERLIEHSMAEYENQLAALRLEVKRLRNYDCYAKDVPHQDLHTELLVMSTQVETLTRERNALVNAAASRALMLERHERATDLFARMTRTRRELEAHLEGREELPPLQSSEHVEISRSLSSICASAADAWTALKAERTRVLHLESAVLSQSLQLEREERVRTQLERRKAILERELLRANHGSSSEAGGVVAKNCVT